MKAKLLIFTALFVLSACDVPQRTRYPNSGVESVSYTDGSDAFDGGAEEEGSGNQDVGDGVESASQDYGPGFEECNLGHRYNGGSVGNFGICQSSQSSRRFKISFAEPSLYEGTCMVPMKYVNGKSYQLGIPECVKNAKDTIYNVPLTSSYNQNINAVMVIKYGQQGEIVNQFQNCMNAKQHYSMGRINYTYGPSCTVSPDAYAQCVCNAFVDNYGDSYKQVVFED